MVVDVECSLVITGAAVAVVEVHVNGVSVFHTNNPVTTTETWVFNVKNIILAAGDTITIIGDGALGSVDYESGSTAKVTPIYVYKSFGAGILPNWSKQKFVSNILRMFNVISAYDSFSKTITFNLFEKIKGKDYIDISAYVIVDETNYESFVGNYGKRNLLTYEQPSIISLSSSRKLFAISIIPVAYS